MRWLNKMYPWLIFQLCSNTLVAFRGGRFKVEWGWSAKYDTSYRNKKRTEIIAKLFSSFQPFREVYREFWKRSDRCCTSGWTCRIWTSRQNRRTRYQRAACGRSRRRGSPPWWRWWVLVTSSPKTIGVGFLCQTVCQPYDFGLTA